MGNLNMEARQIHYRHDDTMTVDNKLLNLEGRVSTLEDGEPAEVSKVDIAPVFSAETAYSAGDYVYHEGHLYKFTADHAAGTWSDNDTESAVVTADLAEQAGDIDSLMSGLINYETQNNINLDVPNRKNVLPLDVSKMKVSNNTGTWSGNSYTVGGITFTLNINDGQIVSVVATGTAEAVATLNAYYNTGADPTEISFDSDFILNGCPSGGGTDTYLLRLWNTGGSVITDTGTGSTLTKGTKINSFDIRIASGYECPSGGVTFYPMLRPSFITDSTFAPYVPSVESRIEAVDFGILPNAINFLPSVAIDVCQLWKNGKVVNGNIKFTTSETIAANNYIISGMPKISTSVANGAAMGAVSFNKSGAFGGLANTSDGTYGAVFVTAELAAGTYCASFSYISA